ncbi:hypothetical protein GCM10009550_79120 [Actinocorallia libanotica]|uniref:Uncharacterized protein n=1 Tax=Actinocorallia libanotica TaxID=46162 RepID=A0ABN1S2L6_9ACTN
MALHARGIRLPGRTGMSGRWALWRGGSLQLLDHHERATAWQQVDHVLADLEDRYLRQVGGGHEPSCSSMRPLYAHPYA